MEDQSFIPLSWTEVPLEEMHLRSKELLEVMRKRRTTRHFSTREVPKELIVRAILCGGTAPSGAHLQPWTFVAISSQELKQKIREAAEAEERKTYQDRMPDAWREVLQPLGTDAVKEHLQMHHGLWFSSVNRNGCVRMENGGRPTTAVKVAVLQQGCSFMPSTTWAW